MNNTLFNTLEKSIKILRKDIVNLQKDIVKNLPLLDNKIEAKHAECSDTVKKLNSKILKVKNNVKNQVNDDLNIIKEKYNILEEKHSKLRDTVSNNTKLIHLKYETEEVNESVNSEWLEKKIRQYFRNERQNSRSSVQKNESILINNKRHNESITSRDEKNTYMNIFEKNGCNKEALNTEDYSLSHNKSMYSKKLDNKNSVSYEDSLNKVNYCNLFK